VKRPFKLYLLLFISGLFPLITYAQTETTEKLAIQYFQNKEFEKAVNLFEALYTSNPTPLYYSYYFDCLVEIGDFKKTEKFLKQQIKRYPWDQKYVVDLGYVYLKSGDETSAKKQFEAAIKDVQPYRESYVNLANGFMLRDQTEYALKTYLKGKKSLKDVAPLNSEIAEIYLKMGNFPSALAEYLDLLESGDESLTQVQNHLQDVLSIDPDNSRNELFRTELLGRIRKNPDKTNYSEVLLWYFIQRKEFESALIQAKALDKRLKEEGQRIYELGKLAVENAAYDAAIECFDYLISRGQSNPYWFASRMDMMNARYLKVTKSYTYTHDDLIKLEKEYIATLDELGWSAQTLPLMSNLAHIQAFYLSKTEEAKAMLNKAIAMPGSQPLDLANCKLELADILLMSGDVWEATLLYSQVEKAFKNEPIGAEAKFRNAKLSFYIGEFEWAKAQLDVLKAATSKLIANDAMQMSLLISDNIDVDSSTVALKIYARADLLLFQNKEDLALQTLDSIQSIGLYHPLFDEVLYKKAEIMLRKRDYALADTLLQKLYSFYPGDILGDDALFKLADLQENIFGNKTKAMELYKELMEKYPGSLYVVEARKRFRALRGDIQNP
jgi:tetratricopeptide (TPR) repeat protein